MFIKRRSAIKHAVVAASVTALPKGLRAGQVEALYQDDIDHHALAGKFRAMALDEAKRLGCDYADIRLCYRRAVDVNPWNGLRFGEDLGLAVRTLVNGYWGFCYTPIWSEKTTRQAIALSYNLAKGNSLGPPREIDGAAYTKPHESGEWIMPIVLDPFQRNPYEFEDYLDGLQAFISGFSPDATDGYKLDMRFNVRNIWFGATNGAMQFQRLFHTGGSAGFRVRVGSMARFDVETLSPSGMGYELFTGQDLYTQLRSGYDEALELCKLQSQPVDVGRYTIVMPGSGTSQLLGTTIGAAVELDRIVGVEANAGGTSFIQAPAEELGQFKIAPETVTVDYQRDEAGAIATRRWDDEGTPCSKGQIIENGIITRAFSNKELATHVKSPDQVALGNAIASDPTIAASVRPGNLMMHADSSSSKSVKDMIAEIDKGFYFRKSTIGLDYQMTNGMITGELYEITRGKLTSRVTDGGCWFNTTELWNNLIAVGGAATQQRVAVMMPKGEPPTDSYNSVTAPAVVFEDATLIDITRK